MYRPGADTLVSGPEHGARSDPFSQINNQLFEKFDTDLHQLWKTHRQAVISCQELLGQGILVANSNPEFGFEFREPILAQDVIVQLYRAEGPDVFHEVCPIRICHEGDICAWLNRISRTPLTHQEMQIIMESVEEIFLTKVVEVAHVAQAL